MPKFDVSLGEVRIRNFAISLFLAMATCLLAVDSAIGQVPPMAPDVLSAIARAEEDHPPRSKELARALEPLVSKLRESKRLDEAAAVAERILDIELVVYGSDHQEVEGTYSNLAHIKVAAGHFAPALKLFEKSLGILEKHFGPTHLKVADRLSEMAILYDRIGLLTQAMPLQERALAILEQQRGPDHRDVAVSLYLMGLRHQRIGQFELALPLLSRSLAILEKDSGPSLADVATAVSILARLYSDLGSFSEALPLYLRSLEILVMQLGPEHMDVARELISLASVYYNQGQLSHALPALQRSLAILDKQHRPRPETEIDVLVDIATLYRDLGQDADALLALQRSLRTGEAQLGIEHVSVARALTALGDYHRARKELDVALPLYQRSLTILENQLDLEHERVAEVLLAMGTLHYINNDLESARGLIERSLAIYEKKYSFDNRRVAEALNLLAILDASKGDYAQAMRTFERTLAMGSISSKHTWAVKIAKAEVHRRMGEPELAIFWGKQAVNGLQTIRHSLSLNLQASFLKNRTRPYTLLAEVLISEGRIPEAQQVLQMLKERELFDEALRGDGSAPTTSQVDLNGVERAKFTDYYRIRDQQVALANERRLLQTKPEAERTAAERTRLEVISRDLFPRVQEAMEAFMAGLQRDLAQRATKSGEPQANVQAIQGRLRQSVEALARPGGEPGARAVALQYVMADKRLSVILTVPGGPPVARQISVDYGDLAHRINQFTADVKSSNKPLDGEKGLLAQARELHRMLIEPVLPDLKKANAGTLMLSLTDVLRFMPFAALYDGERYLIQDYALAQYNEAATSLVGPGVAKWRIAGFGLSDAVDGLPALKEVPVELDAVTSRSRGGKSWLNGPFNRDRLRAALGGDFDVLHLASHFVVKLGDTTGSRLYLGDKSTMSLAQLTGEDMRFDGIDLVTLSACETAVGGGRTSYGQEMESLSARVQQQGAAAVMATLWKVADRSTGALMSRFYENKTKGTVNKAEALRQAQIAMISGEVSVPNSKQLTWKHPFYWAPFVLMGNWR